MITCHFSFTLLFYLVIKLVGKSTPVTSPGLTACLGSYELLYNSGVNLDFCAELPTWSLNWVICKSADTYVIIASTNIIDIILLMRAFSLIQNQTQSIKPMLTKATFKERRR